jgi:phosphoribosyl-ATP pyrophosphohydrolase
MTRVKLTSVRTFPSAAPTKPQALKVLEEAAEVVEAFKQRDPRDVTHIGYATANVLDEIADTIQASCNLAAALGVTDLTPYLARCEERNRRRGRYE